MLFCREILITSDKFWYIAKTLHLRVQISNVRVWKYIFLYICFVLFVLYLGCTWSCIRTEPKSWRCSSDSFTRWVRGKFNNVYRSNFKYLFYREMAIWVCCFFMIVLLDASYVNIKIYDLFFTGWNCSPTSRQSAETSKYELL